MGFLSRYNCFLPCLGQEAQKATNTKKSIKDPFDSPSSSSNLSLSSLPSLPPEVPPLTISQSPPSNNYYCAAVLRGHTSPISSLYLHGNLLFSGSYDNQFRIWTANKTINVNNSNDDVLSSPLTLTEIHSSTTVKASGAVKSIVVVPDGSNYKIFTAHQDHKIRVWKLTGSSTDINDNQRGKSNSLHFRQVATLPTILDCILSFFSPARDGMSYSGVLSFRMRRKTCMWGNSTHYLDTVSALAVSRDGCYLYSGSWDRTVKIWRTKDLRCMETIFGAHDDAINAIVVAGDGRVMITASADKRVRVWKKEGRRSLLVGTLEKHKSAVNAVVMSEDEKVVYSGGNDKLILVWDWEEMVAVGAIRGHGKAVLCLAAVGCECLCSGSADKTVRVWRRGRGVGVDEDGIRRRSYVCLAVLEGHSRPVKCLAVAVDRDGDGGGSGDRSGSRIALCSGGLDRDIRIWRIRATS